MDYSSEQHMPEFSKYYNSMPDSSVLVINNQGKIVFCNDHGLEMLGYAALKKSLVGLHYNTLIENDKREIHDAHVQHFYTKVLTKPDDFFQAKMISREKREMNVQCLNQSLIPCNIFICKSPTLGPEYTVITLHDLRVEKALEKEKIFFYDNMKKELQQVAHELRTPVHGVYGGSTLLGDFLDKRKVDPSLLGSLSPEDYNELKAIHAIILDGATQMYSVAHTYLDGKTKSANLEKGAKKNLLLKEVIEESYSILLGQHKLTKPNIKFSMDCSLLNEPNLFVDGDPTVIKQIILNLAGNALKFTQEGSVTITLKDRVSMGVQSDLMFYVLSISDTGTGLTEEQVLAMWQPMSGIKLPNHTAVPGTGIGLSITKALIESHLNAQVSVRSALGSGTTIELDFSLLKASNQARESVLSVIPVIPASPTGKQQKEKFRILAAEDNKLNQKLLHNYFKGKSGYSLTIVENGQEALNQVASGEFDLVLMDVSMPVLDGISASKQIRLLDDRSKSSIPILFLSANDLDLAALNLAGKTMAILKPYNKVLLFNKMNDILNMPEALCPSSATYIPSQWRPSINLAAHGRPMEEEERKDGYKF